MEDRFKFRVWCDNKGEWEKNDPFIHYDGTLYCWHSGLKPYSLDTHKIMQCTGQKDKNGVLIFEGGICRFTYCNNKLIGKIVFNKATAALEMWNNIVVGAYGEKATNTRLLCHCEKTEVIGTIYESPELLEDT